MKKTKVNAEGGDQMLQWWSWRKKNIHACSFFSDLDKSHASTSFLLCHQLHHKKGNRHHQETSWVRQTAHLSIWSKVWSKKRSLFKWKLQDRQFSPNTFHERRVLIPDWLARTVGYLTTPPSWSIYQACIVYSLCLLLLFVTMTHWTWNGVRMRMQREVQRERRNVKEEKTEKQLTSVCTRVVVTAHIRGEQQTSPLSSSRTVVHKLKIEFCRQYFSAARKDGKKGRQENLLIQKSCWEVKTRETHPVWK